MGTSTRIENILLAIACVMGTPKSILKQIPLRATGMMSKRPDIDTRSNSILSTLQFVDFDNLLDSLIFATFLDLVDGTGA